MNKKTKIIIGVSVGVIAVGITAYIYRQEIKSLAKRAFGGYKWFDSSLEWYRNEKAKDGVNALHPKFKDDVKEFLSWMEKETDWYPIWTSGYRTFEHQAQLKIDNPNNASAGHSNHNYGFAFDMNIKNRKTGVQLRKASSKSSWEKSGIPQKAKEMGMIWGGDFRSYHDPIHFAKEDMPKTSEMLTLHESGKVDSDGYVKV